MSEKADLKTIGNWFAGPAKDARVSKIFAKRLCNEVEALRERVKELEASGPPMIKRKIYNSSPERDGYLKARFGLGSGYSFEFDGHRWAYEHSSFDDSGEYDLIYRPIPPPVEPTKGEPQAGGKQG